MRVAFATLGCKVNQYETEALSELFSSEGFTVVDASEEADVYVVNSCTVTAVGDKKSRQTVRKLKKKHPGAIVALTGCYPQAFPDEALAVAEADVITGSKDRGGLLRAVQKALSERTRVVSLPAHISGEAFEPLEVSGLRGRTRAFLKIEDGCERYCSYCIIPKARGPVRSKPLEEIEKELSALANAGYREAVFVGINLPSYGKEMGLRLIDALRVAQKFPSLRIRLGSLEPELLSDEDIEEMGRMPNLCPHFHLALQSGCDKTLKAMNRHYDVAEYLRIVQKIRSVFLNPSFTTDLMVGFPGETDEDFLESLETVRKIGFLKVHVFPYSPRSGTAAAKRPNQVPPPVKEERSQKMIRLCESLSETFLQSQVGQTALVLVETTKTPFGYEGFTENYCPVVMDCDPSFCGKVVPVKLISVLNGRLAGIPCE